ncbi:MAG TPA: glycerophosphodiester phosphodiesterase [Ilumatobacteraceae bacterium]
MTARTHPFLDWPYPIPFAHRGGASDAPENTMPAFEYAIGLGYRYIETDVQLTTDGVLVAFHDFNLLRTCGVDRKVSEMTWAEVSEARVRGEAPIPKLEEILGSWPEVRVNIDCKSEPAIAGLVSVLRRTNSLDRVNVGAFRDSRVRTLRSILGDRLCTALGPAEVAQLRYGRMTRTSGLTAQVPVSQGPLKVVTSNFIRRAHAIGVRVHVWTIDDADEIGRLLDMGVDGIMTDRPTVLRDVLQQRGQWQSA